MEFTPKQVAEHLGVTERLITLYLNTGKLRGYKISPRKWRIPEESVIEYLEEINKKILGGVINE